MNYINGFSERLLKSINDSGMTYNEIARKCGFDRRVLYRACYENYMPNSGNLARICAVTHTSADWLLGLKRQKHEMQYL